MDNCQQCLEGKPRAQSRAATGMNKIILWVSTKEIWNNIKQPCCFHCLYKQSSSISIWHLIESRVVVVILTMSFERRMTKYLREPSLLRGTWKMPLTWEWDSNVQSNLFSMIHYVISFDTQYTIRLLLRWPYMTSPIK